MVTPKASLYSRDGYESYFAIFNNVNNVIQCVNHWLYSIYDLYKICIEMSTLTKKKSSKERDGLLSIGW